MFETGLRGIYSLKTICTNIDVFAFITWKQQESYLYNYVAISTMIEKQNRSTEGCSNLKRSVDMTSSGKNGLNIRTKSSDGKCP